MHPDVHRGFHQPFSGGDQDRGDRAGPAGQCLVLHAPLVSPDAERAGIEDRDEIGIRPGGLIVFMAADRAAGVEDIEAIGITDEMDDMGHAGVDAVNEKRLVFDLDLVVDHEVLRIGETELDDIAPYFGVDDPGNRLEGQLLARNPHEIGEPGGAPAAVPAHLHL